MTYILRESRRIDKCFLLFFLLGSRVRKEFSQTLTGIQATGKLAPRRLTTSIRPGRREWRQSFPVSRETLRLCDLWSRMQKTRRVTNSVCQRDAMRARSSLLRNLSALPRLTCYPNVRHRANDHLSRETVHRAASVAVQLVAELEAVHQELSRGKQVELAV